MKPLAPGTWYSVNVLCHKATFLLVEDDPNDVDFVRIGFRELGLPIELRVAWDGKDAVDYLNGEGEYCDRDRFPVPDVILLDMKMPRMDGFQFLEWLQRDSPDDMRLIPVIIMASSDDPEEVKRAYALRANAYLVKPVGWDEFQERIKAISKLWVEHLETPLAYDPLNHR